MKALFQIYKPTPRLTTGRFPPYRHLPGVTPHPLRDPEGHSHGLEGARPPLWDESRWWTSHGYLWGVDLYNNAYYWEAHEAWEDIWKIDSREENRLFLQGLIQVSAGLLKRELGNWAGLRKLSRKGLARLKKLASHREFFGGLRLHVFCVRIQRIARSRTYPDWAADPRILLEPPLESGVDSM